MRGSPFAAGGALLLGVWRPGGGASRRPRSRLGTRFPGGRPAHEPTIHERARERARKDLPAPCSRPPPLLVSDRAPATTNNQAPLARGFWVHHLARQAPSHPRCSASAGPACRSPRVPIVPIALTHDHVLVAGGHGYRRAVGQHRMMGTLGRTRRRFSKRRLLLLRKEVQLPRTGSPRPSGVPGPADPCSKPDGFHKESFSKGHYISEQRAAFLSDEISARPPVDLSLSYREQRRQDDLSMIQQAAARTEKTTPGLRPEVTTSPLHSRAGLCVSLEHRTVESWRRMCLCSQLPVWQRGCHTAPRVTSAFDRRWRFSVLISRDIPSNRLQMETYLKENREMEVEIISVNKDYKPTARLEPCPTGRSPCADRHAPPG